VSHRVSAGDDLVENRRDLDMQPDVAGRSARVTMSVGGVGYDADNLLFAHHLAVPEREQQRLADGKSRKSGSASVDVFRVGHCPIVCIIHA